MFLPSSKRKNVDIQSVATTESRLSRFASGAELADLAGAREKTFCSEDGRVVQRFLKRRLPRQLVERGGSTSDLPDCPLPSVRVGSVESIFVFLQRVFSSETAPL